MARVVAQGDFRPMEGNREAMDDLKRILAAREPHYRRRRRGRRHVRGDSPSNRSPPCSTTCAPDAHRPEHRSMADAAPRAPVRRPSTRTPTAIGTGSSTCGATSRHWRWTSPRTGGSPRIRVEAELLRPRRGHRAADAIQRVRFSHPVACVRGHQRDGCSAPAPTSSCWADVAPVEGELLQVHQRDAPASRR